MNYFIREIKDTEYRVLNEFLYDAIFISEGVLPPDRSIINNPELKVYTENFGQRSGDNCLVAEVNEKIVGAVWVRIMNDYGHIDDETPSFAIALYKEYRGLGIGTEMMKRMLYLLKEDGYKQASLSVQKQNYASKMYLKLGFEIAYENAEEYIMLISLRQISDL